MARMLSHEIDVEKGIQLLSLELADNVEDVNTLIRSVQHEQFMDNMYWSRKNWRMTVIDEYLTSQRQALQTALTGSCEESKALAILSTTEVRGIGPVRHYSLAQEQHTLTEIMYTDTGTFTKVSTTDWANGTALIIQTQARMYMVSKHYQPGTSLNMQEARIVAPIKADCALAIHTQNGRYEVIQGGTMLCWTHGVSFARVTVQKGHLLHRDDRDYCSNECMQIGHKGYMIDDKHMPTQPTIHPADMRQFQQDKIRGDQTTAHKGKRLENGHQLMHDQMTRDIKDSEDIIQEIRDRQDNTADVGLHVGAAAAVVSLLTVLSLLLICARCGWKRCSGRGAARGGDIELTHRQVHRICTQC